MSVDPVRELLLSSTNVAAADNRPTIDRIRGYVPGNRYIPDLTYPVIGIYIHGFETKRSVLTT